MGTTLTPGPAAPCTCAARTPAGRTPASPDAVQRRRLNRRAARLHRQKLAEKTAERRDPDTPRPKAAAREALVVARMLRRYVPFDQRSRPLFKLYAYWQARKCGWDVMCEALRYEGGGRDAEGNRILVEPEACRMWRWWASLHWKQRYEIAGGGRFILRDDFDDVVEIAPTNSYLAHEKQVA